MICELKSLGLALMVPLALSAMAASTASAQDPEKGVLSTADGGSATLTGTENVGGGAINALTTFGGKTECPGSTYTGHRVLTHAQTTAGGKHQLLQSGDTTFTITPHYKQENCASTGSLGTFPATVDMTGCDYVFYLGATTPKENGEGTYSAGTDIVCPSGKHIDINVFSDENHENNICKITITPEGTGVHPGKLTGLHATDNEDGTITVKGAPHSIGKTNPIHREGLCTLDGKGSTDDEGEFHTDIDLTAHDAEQDPVAIAIGDENEDEEETARY